MCHAPAPGPRQARRPPRACPCHPRQRAPGAHPGGGSALRGPAIPPRGARAPGTPPGLQARAPRCAGSRGYPKTSAHTLGTCARPARCEAPRPRAPPRPRSPRGPRAHVGRRRGTLREEPHRRRRPAVALAQGGRHAPTHRTPRRKMHRQRRGRNVGLTPIEGDAGPGPVLM